MSNGYDVSEDKAKCDAGLTRFEVEHMFYGYADAVPAFIDYTAQR